jgi:hypothetical protein
MPDQSHLSTRAAAPAGREMLVGCRLHARRIQLDAIHARRGGLGRTRP